MHIRFIAGEFATGIRRNLAMTLSVILVTFVSLSFVGMAMLFQAQIGSMKGYWYDKVQVSIFLCTKDSQSVTCPNGEVTQTQRQSIESDLNSAAFDPYVESVQYESKEEAFVRFQEQFADDPNVTQNVTVAQMPESYRVKLRNPEEYRIIAERFAGTMGVDDVVDQRSVLDQLFTVLNRLTMVAAALALLMVVAALLLINTTIRLSAFNRRREVGIMRLVGASSIVIQLPFFLEGVFAAVLGAAVASGGLWGLLYFGGGRWVTGDLKLTYVGVSELIAIIPVLFVIAVVLAGMSSAIALNRYLKV